MAMAESTSVPNLVVRAQPLDAPRHSAVVRFTHWITFLAFLALLLTGLEIVISHPRFYWGDVGNMNTPPVFSLPIPASRATVATGYGYVLPDQNGWSRALHFEAAWVLVLAGTLYAAFGVISGHFRRNLLPVRGERSPRALAAAVLRHLRFTWLREDDGSSYSTVQRVTYLLVVLVLFPMMVWTGLAMSPAMEGAVPWAVVLLGGRQTARTLHFFLTITLVLFLVIHVLMVVVAGFRHRVGAMITGRSGRSGVSA